MVHYIKTIDELIDLVDREFGGRNAVCPICSKKIGTVDIPNVELGLPELKFTQFKNPGIYCIEGHCIVSMEDTRQTAHFDKIKQGAFKIYIEDLGIKVFEVMKLIKPYLNIGESVPNTQIYWMLMDRSNPIYLKGADIDDTCNLLEGLQKLGARVRIEPL